MELKSKTRRARRLLIVLAALAAGASVTTAGLVAHMQPGPSMHAAIGTGFMTPDTPDPVGPINGGA